MLISGQVDMKTFGPAKVFFIAKRVPISELINLSSDLIMVLDHEMVVQLVNTRFLEVFLVPRSDLIVHHIEHTRFGLSISPELRQMITEGKNGNERVIEEYITINGHKWHFFAKCVPVVFEEGERGVSVILRDVNNSNVHS